MIKNMVKVLLNGLMEENIREDGNVENNMEEVGILEVMEKKKKVNGLKEKE